MGITLYDFGFLSLPTLFLPSITSIILLKKVFLVVIARAEGSWRSRFELKIKIASSLAFLAMTIRSFFNRLVIISKTTLNHPKSLAAEATDLRPWLPYPQYFFGGMYPGKVETWSRSGRPTLTNNSVRRDYYEKSYFKDCC